MRYLLVFLLIAACTTLVQKPIEPLPDGRIALSWETKPERREWSDHLTRKIMDSLSYYDNAKDIEEMCPSYRSLDERRKIKAIAEFWVALGKFESGWEPTTRFFETTMGYYSEGLFQLSIPDEQWVKCGLNKSNILEPLKNIECAHKIMIGQLKNKGKITLTRKERGFYWAPLIIDGKWTKIKEIKERMKEYGGCR